MQRKENPAQRIHRAKKWSHDMISILLYIELYHVIMYI